jgi:hypothetical protein
MNRSLLAFIFVLCSCLSALAQPNLRKQTLPAPFSSFSMYVCDTTGVRTGSPGTAQIWNYASLVKRGNDTTFTIYTDKSVLKDPAKFPNGEVVVIDDTTTSIYRTINNQWRLEGWITPTTEMVVGVDPYDVRPSEIVFNDPKFDIFNGTVQSPFPTPGAKNVTGAHAYVYDGFGQLVLPDFTYNNVARTTQRDTLSVEVTIGPQKAVVKTISRKTSWQEVSSNIPLFIIDESTIQVFNANNVSLFGPFSFKTVRYRRHGQTTDVQEDPSHSLLVAPCPSSGDQVTIMGLIADPRTVLVINAIGEQMVCPTSQTEQGVKIDIRDLSKGSYTVLVLEGQVMRTVAFTR